MSNWTVEPSSLGSSYACIYSGPNLVVSNIPRSAAKTICLLYNDKNPVQRVSQQYLDTVSLEAADYIAAFTPFGADEGYVPNPTQWKAKVKLEVERALRLMPFVLSDSPDSEQVQQPQQPSIEAIREKVNNYFSVEHGADAESVLTWIQKVCECGETFDPEDPTDPVLEAKVRLFRKFHTDHKDGLPEVIDFIALEKELDSSKVVALREALRQVLVDHQMKRIELPLETHGMVANALSAQPEQVQPNSEEVKAINERWPELNLPLPEQPNSEKMREALEWVKGYLRNIDFPADSALRVIDAALSP